MDQAGIKEILEALKLYSAHMDEKLNAMMEKFEKRMDNRFDRIEAKLSGFRVE